MAFLYLSPSTQEYNPYVNGGNEEYYMNLLADELEPYLHASGISFTRNTPSMTAATSIAASNAGDYDLHLALHSNATAGDQAGTTTGIDLYYNPESAESLRAAQLIQQQLKTVYPDPTKVAIVPTTSLGEVYKVRAPGVLAELGYHDNPSDPGLDPEQPACHRPKSGQGGDRVFRPALFGAASPAGGCGGLELGRSEPAGSALHVRAHRGAVL